MDGNEPSDPSSDNSSDDEEVPETYQSLLKKMSEDWLKMQLTHHVSLTATNDFWSLAFKHIFEICSLKAEENVQKNVPQFLHLRNIMYRDACPDVKLTFAFKDLTDGSIILVNNDKTPLTQFQRDPRYEKLYEEAHVEVIILCQTFPDQMFLHFTNIKIRSFKKTLKVHIYSKCVFKTHENFEGTI